MLILLSLILACPMRSSTSLSWIMEKLPWLNLVGMISRHLLIRTARILICPLLWLAWLLVMLLPCLLVKLCMLMCLVYLSTVELCCSLSLIHVITLISCLLTSVLVLAMILKFGLIPLVQKSGLI